MYSNILVAIAPDHGEGQVQALHLALHLATDANARITAITSIEPISAYIPDLAEADLNKERGARALTELRHMVGERSEIDARVDFKPAAIAILDLAEEIGADCIVMSSHKPGLSRFLLGSTASRVVRHASCSVHVLR